MGSRGNAVEVVADTESVDFGSCAVTGDSSCIEDPSDADSFGLYVLCLAWLADGGRPIGGFVP